MNNKITDILHYYNLLNKINDIYNEKKFPYNINSNESDIIITGNKLKIKKINKYLFKKISDSISIKKYGNAESLNVAISSAIILDNIRNS